MRKHRAIGTGLTFMTLCENNLTHVTARVTLTTKRGENMRTRKRIPTHPGGILKRQYMEPLSLTVSDLAGTLGVSRKTLSKIVNERGDVTPAMALRLARAFSTTPEFWINLQRTYDLWEASRKSNDWKLVEAIAG